MSSSCQLWNAFIFKNHHVEDCPSVPPGIGRRGWGGGRWKNIKKWKTNWHLMPRHGRTEPVFVNLWRSLGIDSSLAESIPWKWFLGSLNVYKYGLCSSGLIVWIYRYCYRDFCSGNVNNVERISYISYTAILKLTIPFEPAFQLASFGFWCRNRGCATIRFWTEDSDSHEERTSCTFPSK